MVDKINMFLIWLIISVCLLIIWNGLALGKNTDRNDAMQGCFVKYSQNIPNEALTHYTDMVEHCTCVLDKLELLVFYTYNLSQEDKYNFILEHVYLPCSVKLRKKV